MVILQNSGVPIYLQIAEQMKADIISGKIKQNEYLPSIRGLAKDLRISVITTMKAYDELAEEGYVTAVQGKGYLVNPQDTEMMREQHLRRVEDGLTDAIKAAKLAGIGSEELKNMLEVLLEDDQ
jgi:GntR family transcriptional regulator